MPKTCTYDLSPRTFATPIAIGCQTAAIQDSSDARTRRCAWSRNDDRSGAGDTNGWAPIHSDDELARMADLLRVGQPVEPLYDVLELLLGPSGALADAEIEGLVGRLQGVPGRLAAVVVEWFKGRPEGRAGRLVERARALERDDEAVAVGGPLGYLRRLAVVTEGLLDVLLEGAPPVVVA